MGQGQEYLFKVGDQALRIAADAEAVDHYERALEAYGRAFGERWDPFERAAVERKIGEARYRLGEFERAPGNLDRRSSSSGSLGHAREVPCASRSSASSCVRSGTVSYRI